MVGASILLIQGWSFFIAVEIGEQHSHKINDVLMKIHQSSALKMLPPKNATCHTAKSCRQQ